MVARGREEAQGSGSSGEEVEGKEAVILAAGERPEMAGVGRGEPATVKATTVSRELGVGLERGGKERRVGLVRPSQTGLSVLTVGSDQWARGSSWNF